MLARPALRRVLGEAEPTAYGTGLVEGLLARVGSGLEDALKTAKEPVAFAIGGGRGDLCRAVPEPREARGASGVGPAVVDAVP